MIIEKDPMTQEEIVHGPHISARIFYECLLDMSPDKRQRLMDRSLRSEKILICNQCGDWIEESHSSDDCVIYQVMCA